VVIMVIDGGYHGMNSWQLDICIFGNSESLHRILKPESTSYKTTGFKTEITHNQSNRAMANCDLVGYLPDGLKYSNLTLKPHTRNLKRADSLNLSC
jgi:hypothetical protein